MPISNDDAAARIGASGSQIDLIRYVDRNNDTVTTLANNPVHAAYNFVPLSKFVWLPDWNAAVSHDLPFREGWNGEIAVEITADTPILVGREREDGNAVHFATGPDGKPAIPGSTLRGLLRNITKIAAFGRFDQVDDRRFGVRDLTPGGQFYRSKIVRTSGRNPQVVKPLAHSGWLWFDHADKAWKIRPCKYARVEHDLLKQSGWVRAPSPQGKEKQEDAIRDPMRWRGNALRAKGLTPWFAPPTVTENRGRRNLAHVFAGVSQLFESKDRVPGGAAVQGVLVFTGKVGGKHREFLFYNASPVENAVPVPPDVMRAFQDVNPLKQEGGKHLLRWRDWYDLLRTGEVGPGKTEPGVPVFYFADEDGQIGALGVAQMPKLPFDQTVGQMVENTDPRHRSANGYDMAELLFGCIRPNGVGSLRGRVSCGLSRLQEEPRWAPVQSLVLNGPKASYYPFYVAQPKASPKTGELPKGADYATYFQHTERAPPPEIRGWKRYWARPALHGHDLERPPVEQPDKTESVLHPLKAGSRFTGRITFHNLLPEELGALFWVLGFGEDASRPGEERHFRHMIGMGKPFGFGSVRIRVTDARLEANDLEAASAPLTGADAIARLREAQQKFAGAISAAYKQETKGKAGQDGWSTSEQIQSLLAMANPEAELPPPGSAEHMTLVTSHHLNRFQLAKGRIDQPAPDVPQLPARALPPPVEVGHTQREQTRFPRRAEEGSDRRFVPPPWLNVPAPQGPAPPHGGPGAAQPARAPINDEERRRRLEALRRSRGQ